MSLGRPPRGARWLLRRFVPDDAHDNVLGDLEEVFHTIAEREGFGRARRWYWGQAISFSARFASERARDVVAGLSWRNAPSALDFKLGARMLAKSPLLTLTGCVAIATAIGINASFNEFMRDMFAVVDMLETDEQIVAIANYDVENGGRDPRALSDVSRWRSGLQTVEDIGVYIDLEMSLVGQDGSAVSVDVGEMSASGFRVSKMVPELGRSLLDTDDTPVAEPVALLAHHAWQRLFAGDPDIVGSSIQLGQIFHRVVGVAPADFQFPSTQDMWVNFRRDAEAYPPRAGPPVVVFGRLAQGRSLEEAEQEIEQFGRRAAADDPLTHARVRPSVMPFSEGMGMSLESLRWGLWVARTLLILLLVVACANIATLVFARNAGRESEIAIRNALGAGRPRIIMQLFAEAMVLALISAGVGLLVANWGPTVRRQGPLGGATSGPALLVGPQDVASDHSVRLRPRRARCRSRGHPPWSSCDGQAFTGGVAADRKW